MGDWFPRRPCRGCYRYVELATTPTRPAGGNTLRPREKNLFVGQQLEDFSIVPVAGGPPVSVLSLHVIVPKNHPSAEKLLGNVDAALERIRESGQC